MTVNPWGMFSVPGTYVTEDTYGKVPAALADHSLMYMLMFSNKAGAPVDELTFISSLADFDNTFGPGYSRPSVQLFFAQFPESGFYCVNVPSRASRSVSVTLGAVGSVYSLTIDGYVVSYTSVVGDTAPMVLSALADKVNSTATHLASMVSGNLRLVDSDTVVSSSGNVTLGAVVPAATYPVAQDVVDSATKVLVSDLRQGFIVAPEFYLEITDMAQRALLANSLDALCARDGHKWVNVVDCGEEVATATTGAGALNLALKERAMLQSPAGHSWYFFPHWVNGDNVNVPMSTSVVAVAIKRYRVNFADPPAGTSFPVYGVTSQTFRVRNEHQGILNPVGVNCGRIFDEATISPRKGACIYGCRTLSTSGFWKFGTTRVIANVLEGTLRYAFDTFIFQSVDGEGEAFNRIMQTAVSICERMRLSRAFYGKTPDEAYFVVCDERNNPLIDLEAGRVNVDVYFKPAPMLEILIIRVHRTSLDTVITEAFSQANSGTSTEGKAATAPTEAASSSGS